MILSGKDIKEAIWRGDTAIDPLKEECLQSVLEDLHLDRHFLVCDTNQNHLLIRRNPLDDMMKEVAINDNQPFLLHPCEFDLGLVCETAGVSSKLVGRLEG